MNPEKDIRRGWWRRFMDWLLEPLEEPTGLIEPELPAKIFVRRDRK